MRFQLILGTVRPVEEPPARGSRSKSIRANDLAAIFCADRPPGLDVDCVFDEPDRAVAQRHVHSTGMITRRGDRVVPTAWRSPRPICGVAREFIGRVDVCVSVEVKRASVAAVPDCARPLAWRVGCRRAGKRVATLN